MPKQDSTPSGEESFDPVEAIERLMADTAKKRHPQVNLSRVRFHVVPKPESFFTVRNGRRYIRAELHVALVTRSGTLNREFFPNLYRMLDDVIEVLAHHNRVQAIEVRRDPSDSFLAAVAAR